MMFESAMTNKPIIEALKARNLERLRDEFAMAALTGLTSATDSEGMFTFGSSKDVADCAYDIADAMLKAREQSK